MMRDDWILTYEGLDREQEGLREALCTLGNGVFAIRGAAEEHFSDEIHYPGTYIAGGYNELASEVAGRTVVNEDLVNFPNWLWLTMRPDQGEWLNLWEMEVLNYRQELDIRGGVLSRIFEFKDSEGRITAVESRRFVHMGKHHLAGLQWKVVARNWSGRLWVCSGLDGSVINDNVARYRQLESKHLDVLERGTVAPEGLFLKVRTNTSDIELAQAARTRVFGEVKKADRRRRIMEDHPERIAEEIGLHLEQGQEVWIEKVVAQFTSRDRAIGEVGKTARMAMGDAADFEALLRDHKQAWDRLWYRCDVRMENADGVAPPEYEPLALRLHIFHLLQTASPNTVGRDVGIPARGLHGEAYRGHIFWDEVFMLPFFTQRLPSVSRSAILYRYHRLDGARKLAAQDGHRGAAFPWQSASDGRETTQELHLNPRSGSWDPDYSHLQRHINSAITYNVWTYFQATGDRAFMEEFGAEIVLEIALFWSSLAEFNESRGRFEIKGVMGPDEYHEKYPGADTGGVDNNVYTNITAVWCLMRARDILNLISTRRASELRESLEIDDEEIERWDEITRKMIVVFHDGVISQFEGYEDLEEFDWAGYRKKYGNIERLDRILKAEGDTPDRYQVSKQADVTMLLYLFDVDQLQDLFGRLGYEFGVEDIYRNLKYYGARTSHGSTLSRVVYTSGVHRHNCEEASQFFLAALQSDLYDVQGGTTQEGVHLGAMAGTVDIVMRYYGGLQFGADRLIFSPHLPHRVERIEFCVLFRDRWLDVELTHECLRISIDDISAEAVEVEVNGEVFSLSSGEEISVEITHPEELDRSVFPSDEDEEMAPPIDLHSQNDLHSQGGGQVGE